MRVAVILSILVALPSTAGAQSAAEPEEDVAVNAARVHDEHCTAVAGVDSQAAGQAMQPVTEAWVRVSQEFEGNPRAYLLYWRGVLAQCLSQEDKAVADLAKFVGWYRDAGPTSRNTYSALDKDARKRLRRLDSSSGGPDTTSVAVGNPGLAAAGVVGLGAGGLLAGLSAWQATETQNTYDVMVSPIDGKDFDALIQQGDASHGAAIGLAVGAGVAAAVGAVLLPLSTRRGPARAALVVPAPLPDGGMVLAVGGRW